MQAFYRKKSQKDFSGSWRCGGSKVAATAGQRCEGMVVEAAKIYRPLHVKVRAIERDARVFEGRIANLETRISRMRGNELAASRAKLEEKVKGANKSRDALLATIPSDWKDKQTAFAKLTKNEGIIRNKFRRAADGAYEGVSELSAILASSADYKALASGFAPLRLLVASSEPKENIEHVKEFANKFTGIAGASKVKSSLNKVRRALKKKKPDVEKALMEFDKAEKLYTGQVGWRAKAEGKFSKGLTAYQDALRGSVGLRQQQKMTREQGLFIATCQSGHRDVSLNF